MYKANSLSTFLKDEMSFDWEDDMFRISDDDDDDDEDGSFDMMRKPATTIRFSDKVRTQEIPCISDMEINEVADVWYSQQYRTSMNAECRQLAKSVTISGSRIIEESADICLRGLEEKLHRSQKKMNRSEAICAVLAEQDDQFHYGEQNPEMIAHVYHEYAAHCLAEAAELALRDQEIALKIHHNGRHASNSSSSSLSHEDDRCISSNF